ncbi:DDE-type integrase/transposase/recombinase [Alkaliphilus hydrothermalis]|uniref:Transposase InsO family protein n=1 Tax=Alkaliphilus hydrothermalis TaxID=1482730 RepID=A0ABS2NT99_9FIRM|nr:DDE-type integrase/transposase/recombinase [Alkaliphilus hydrothermalis]MBM7616190.1 transposase InsO family protein [Alkaliphilus hydrothermalis]
MITQRDREAVALKRFSLISPVLNGQVQSHKQYFEEVCAKPIDMPHYGVKNYSPKTLGCWYALYLKEGIDALKPKGRSDQGQSRRINSSVGDAIVKKIAKFPRITKHLLYYELIKDGIFTPKDISLATFYRYLSGNPYLLEGENREHSTKEFKRFSHAYVNELWQTDIMYGPYIKTGHKKEKTYLVAYIDDASRLITHASFSLQQNFQALRATFKEAILHRGIPKLLYTDNGKIYRCNQLEMICASVGISLLHAKPYTPTSKGKIERFFNTVRMRFLSCLDIDSITDLEDLNQRFSKWLLEDYQCKAHSSIGMSPLDFFMSQADRIKLFNNPSLLEEHFLIRVKRKIHHDATLTIDSILFETDRGLANRSLEVRYDPTWLENSSKSLLLFDKDRQVGIARVVNFYDNSRVKRKSTSSEAPKSKLLPINEEREELQESKSGVSFMNLMEEVHIKKKEGM